MPVVASKIRRGLALPLARSPGGYFSSKLPLNLAWGDLLMALMTPVGSRPMRRSFGSQVSKILFRPDVVVDDPVVIYVVGEAAKQWCPQVNVTSIHVTPPAAFNAQAGVTVNFTLAGSAA